MVPESHVGPRGPWPPSTLPFFGLECQTRFSGTAVRLGLAWTGAQELGERAGETSKEARAQGSVPEGKLKAPGTPVPHAHPPTRTRRSLSQGPQENGPKMLCREVLGPVHRLSPSLETKEVSHGWFCFSLNSLVNIECYTGFGCRTQPFSTSAAHPTPGTARHRGCAPDPQHLPPVPLPPPLRSPAGPVSG